MTGEILAGIVGAVLSLGFSYIPGVKDWFDKLESGVKQAVMGILLVATAAVVFGLSCFGIDVNVVCTSDGAIGLLKILFVALASNSSVYQITKK